MTLENSHKYVVFVRTSSTARVPVYRHLKEQLGYRLVMMHPGETYDFAPLFDHWIDCETNEVDVLEAALRAAMKEKHFTPSAILSFDEYGVYPAAQLAERFQQRPLPLSPQGLRNTTVKSQFRDWCTTHKIGSPKFGRLMSPSDDLDEALSHLTFPCVVKPSPGAGSMLTKRVKSLEELRRCIPSLWASLNNHPALIHLEALGTKVHLLVEEFVGGQEVDVDCVIENGKVTFCGISDNFEVKPPYFCEQGGLCPSALGAQEQKALRQLLEDFVSSHGTELHGVLHFEAKYDFARGKAYVIEVNCRPGSAETHTMVEQVYGVHLGECLTKLALGESLESLQLAARQEPQGYAASVNIYPQREGIIASLSVPHDPSLVAFMPLAAGTAVAPPPKSFGLSAWMVASGASAQEAKGNIDLLTDRVDFQLCPTETEGQTSEMVDNSSFLMQQ